MKESPCSHLLNTLPVQDSQILQPHTPIVKLGTPPGLSAEKHAAPGFPMKLMTRASNWCFCQNWPEYKISFLSRCQVGRTFNLHNAWTKMYDHSTEVKEIWWKEQTPGLQPKYFKATSAEETQSTVPARKNVGFSTHKKPSANISQMEKIL